MRNYVLMFTFKQQASDAVMFHLYRNMMKHDFLISP